MKQEAKFSVILPAGNYTAAQIETLEQTSQKYGLRVSLPLRSDKQGNLIVSCGLSLREAQMLRRQIAGCGFPADVVSDTSDSSQNLSSPSSSTATETMNIELDDIPSLSALEAVGDITSDAWSSLEMPSSLDLGLTDGADLDKEEDWSGESWLAPDPTIKSLSAKEILQNANRHISQSDVPTKNNLQAANISLLETLEKSSKLNSTSTQKIDVSKIQQDLLREASGDFDFKAESADAEKKTQKEDASEEADGADADNAQTQESKAEQESAEAEQESVHADEPKEENSAENADALVKPKGKMHPVLLISIILIALVLILVCVHLFVMPFPFLESLIAPLF